MCRFCTKWNIFPVIRVIKKLIKLQWTTVLRESVGVIYEIVPFLFFSKTRHINVDFSVNKNCVYTGIGFGHLVPSQIFVSCIVKHAVRKKLKWHFNGGVTKQVTCQRHFILHQMWSVVFLCGKLYCVSAQRNCQFLLWDQVCHSPVIYCPGQKKPSQYYLTSCALTFK